MSTRQQDDLHALLNIERWPTLHEQLVIEKSGGYKALGPGPLEPEPKQRLSYEDYLQLKRMQFP